MEPELAEEQPQPVEQKPKKQPSWALPAIMTAGGNAADILSSLHTLNRLPGSHEANPVFGGSTAAMVGIKAASTIPQIMLERYLTQHGHPTAGKVLGAALGGLGGAMAIRNESLGR